MTDDLEVRLEIGMAEAVDKARVEKDAWKDMEEYFEGRQALGEIAAFTGNGPAPSILTRYRNKAHERYLYWQREEEMRRKALRHWRKEDE